MPKRATPPTHALQAFNLREQLLRWFDEQKSVPHKILVFQEIPASLAAAEIDALKEALLAVLSTLERLTGRYNVPLAPLLDILAQSRLSWRFGRTGRSGRPWPRRKLATMSKRLRESAAFLDDFTPLIALVAHERNVAAFDRCQNDPRALAALTAGEDPDEWLRRRVTFPWQALRHDAALLLNVAAEVCDGLNWARTRLVGKTGRRKLYVERAAAIELVAFFKAHTNRELLDHATVLMRATFPSLEEWKLGTERQRDWIKPLLVSHESHVTRKGKKTRPKA